MTEFKKYFQSKKYLLEHYNQLGDLKNDFRNWNLMQLIASKVNGKSVLDIGCGNGHLLGILNKKGIVAFGIEPNKNLISLAKRMNPKLKIFIGYAEDIYKLKRRFDTITMIDVLEHIRDDESQIKKIHDQLNPGGRLILVVPAFKALYGKRDINLGHYRRYSKREIAKKLLKNHFKINAIRHWNMLGVPPYIFFEKILDKELNTDLRTNRKKGVLKYLLNKSFNFWFKYIENNINPGFGLSLICIAEKAKAQKRSKSR